jgi:hypothetical protein
MREYFAALTLPPRKNFKFAQIIFAGNISSDALIFLAHPKNKKAGTQAGFLSIEIPSYTPPFLDNMSAISSYPLCRANASAV